MKFIAWCLLALGSPSVFAENASATGKVFPTLKNLSSVSHPADFPGVTPFAMAPAQIKALYGFNLLPARLQGSGQTIAVVDAYGDANIQADVNHFSALYGLPTSKVKIISSKPYLPGDESSVSGKCLSILYNPGNGTANCSGANWTDAQSWSVETSLDVEWSHAIAPQATIVLVVSPDDSFFNILNAIDCASESADIVSMSVSAPESGFTESPLTYENHFQPGVTYIAATGDQGDFGSGQGANWPAVSANVLAVGGTSVSSTNAKTFLENAWSDGGGGTSLYYSLPSFQIPFLPLGSANRTIPDVAYDSDPRSGFAIYNSDLCPSRPSLSVGGTSDAAPQWAGLIALAAAEVATPIGVVAPLLYGASAPPAPVFPYTRDITSGCDGAGDCAGVGYDIATGIGSPKANLLVPYLIGQDVAVTSVVVTGPPAAGGRTPISVTVANVGRYPSPSFLLSLYANLASTQLTTTPANAGTLVTPLAAGATATFNLIVSYPVAGHYSLWALADSGGAIVEMNETNNAYGPVPVLVGPDLVITSIVPATTTPPVGATDLIQVTVANVGNEAAGAFGVGIYQNQTAVPKFGQTPNGTAVISSLAPQSLATVTIPIKYGAAGPKTLWGLVNYLGELGESDKTNNTFGPITVTVP